jgi:hypothetical protein
MTTPDKIAGAILFEMTASSDSTVMALGLVGGHDSIAALFQWDKIDAMMENRQRNGTADPGLDPAALPEPGPPDNQTDPPA